MRDIKQLCPELQVMLPQFISTCTSQGLKVGIGECYRTASEQDVLYAKGRTTAGSIVTNCTGGSYSSPHQWGVAFDFYRNDGKGAFDDSDGFFYKAGAVGKSLGLEWGGDWKGFRDKPHLQLAKFFRNGTTGYLKRTYGTPNKFMKTWKAGATMIKSDTTSDVSIKRGAYYTAKFSGADNIAVTAGTGGVATVVTFARGSDKLAAIVPIGKVGDATGIYATVPGGQPVKQFNVKIS